MSGDKSLEKKRRGRGRKAEPHDVVENADVLRTQFSHAWPTLGNQLLAARSSQRVMGVLKNYGGMIGGLKDLDFSTRVFEIIRDPFFGRFTRGRRSGFAPALPRDLCERTKESAAQDFAP